MFPSSRRLRLLADAATTPAAATPAPSATGASASSCVPRSSCGLSSVQRADLPRPLARPSGGSPACPAGSWPAGAAGPGTAAPAAGSEPAARCTPPPAGPGAPPPALAAGTPPAPADGALPAPAGLPPSPAGAGTRAHAGRHCGWSGPCLGRCGVLWTVGIGAVGDDLGVGGHDASPMPARIGRPGCSQPVLRSGPAGTRGPSTLTGRVHFCVEDFGSNLHVAALSPWPP